jgi:hypothetical protein
MGLLVLSPRKPSFGSTRNWMALLQALRFVEIVFELLGDFFGPVGSRRLFSQSAWPRAAGARAAWARW